MSTVSLAQDKLKRVETENGTMKQDLAEKKDDIKRAKEARSWPASCVSAAAARVAVAVAVAVVVVVVVVSERAHGSLHHRKPLKRRWRR